MKGISSDSCGLVSATQDQAEGWKLALPRSDAGSELVPREILDDFKHLAERVCDVPFAMISLAGDVTGQLEAPFSDLMLGAVELVLVPDAAKDPRLVGKLKTGGGQDIRFFAGAPLVATDGNVLGTLSVMDYMPRILTPGQEESLRILCRQAAAQIELRRELAISEGAAGSAKAQAALLTAPGGNDLQGVVYANAAGVITAANDAFLKMVGYSREDLKAGLLTWALLTPPDADISRNGDFTASDLCLPLEKSYLRKDGSLVPVLVGSAPFDGEGLRGFTFVVDLTDRKQQEQQYLRVHRIESVRTLARGLSHDLNNVFAPIIMALDLFKMRFPDAASQELISLIETSAHRGADMVKQVTAFARGIEGQRVEVPLRPLLDDSEVLNSGAFVRTIQVIKFIPRDLWPVVGDPSQLEKVISNLCQNASDAMPHGGRLTISAANLTLDRHFAEMLVEAKAGPYVLLQLADTGHGISPAALERIFDPYFSTRGVGSGTGLGLSVVHALVKSHGGFIRVISDVGKGTTFKIYLPARPEAVASLTSAPTGGLPHGHGELILVVDDEAPVRLVTSRLLETYGYRVVVAADAEEALALHARHGNEIAVVLTDIMMPGMDGIELSGRLRALDSRLPIIAASGVASKGRDLALGAGGINRFLPKPYSAETLLTTLEELLRGTPRISSGESGGK